MQNETREIPSVERRAELVTKMRGTMQICTVLHDAAGKGLVEALIAKGYGLIGDSTRADPLGDGEGHEGLIQQTEDETVVAVAGPFYMRGDIERTMAWADMSGMKVLNCPAQEFKEGLEASEPVDEAQRVRFGEVSDPVERAEKLLEVLQRLIQLKQGITGGPNREDCEAADKITVHAKFPDADVEVELCMACVERYISGDMEGFDIMDEPLVRRAILAAFVSQHPTAKLPNARIDTTTFTGQNAPSTDTPQ